VWLQVWLLGELAERHAAQRAHVHAGDRCAHNFAHAGSDRSAHGRSHVRTDGGADLGPDAGPDDRPDTCTDTAPLPHGRSPMRPLSRRDLLRAGHQRLQVRLQDGLPRELAPPAPDQRARMLAYHVGADPGPDVGAHHRAHTRPDTAPVPPWRHARLRCDRGDVRRDRTYDLRLRVPQRVPGDLVVPAGRERARVREVHLLAHCCPDAAADTAAYAEPYHVPDARPDTGPDSSAHGPPDVAADAVPDATTDAAPVLRWLARLRQIRGRHLLPRRRQRVPLRMHGGIRRGFAARAAAQGAPVHCHHSGTDHGPYHVPDEGADANADARSDSGRDAVPDAATDAAADGRAD